MRRAVRSGSIGWCLGLAAAVFACLGLSEVSRAQLAYQSNAVGGVSINAEGLLENATVDAVGTLRAERLKMIEPMSTDLKAATSLRKISLRGLEKAIAELLEDGKPLSDEMRYLAGLQRIEYVFVYPEQGDIVLAGHGAGWTVNEKGAVVGTDTGRPVMLLDDLLVALRTAQGSAQQGISCSIDPTTEGLNQFRKLVSGLKTIGNPSQTISAIENALGLQTITVRGVPDTTHFARVLVAADFRMKRIAMNFEPSPVRGLPSFLEMVGTTGRGMNNMFPRWWLTPNFEPLLRDVDGLAWKFQGTAVKTMTEQEILKDSGEREQTGKASPMAQRWAESMTKAYPELAVADPVFGQLQNCMELAVVGALVVRENLTEKANYSFPILMDTQKLETISLNAPANVRSQASVLRKGKKWIISASGGVEIPSFTIAGVQEPSNAIYPVREKAENKAPKHWWWN